ncbi:APC family permease [Piscinibacter sp.]|jgi:amino acid transporter|uniref:APC family permease n=1 Tax=Piscinibacter sp. TaxID=1903157 RepID=UPI002F417DC7
MKRSARLRESLLGKPLDPFSGETRRHVVLVAFLAWIGLGADGLSSACYGPEEAFLALGAHTPLSLYLAALTAVTVFVIAVAYNQVIELFPSGGGGYKVATSLLGPYAGLVSGSALVVDYVLTISISVASGVDALFSLLPAAIGNVKLGLEVVLSVLLVVLNLRGMKESIRFLLPIFLGFVATHVALIGYGILAHIDRLPALIPGALADTRRLGGELGWVAVAALLLRAYSLGGGTYTGIEAVSNNVQSLAEPRVRTGKWTMFYMALSLAFTAGGIILLYLLWDAHHVPGRTLNAVTFESIIASFGLPQPAINATMLVVVLAFEAGLLFVAANTGFLGGPAVLANMAVDSWMPHQFRNLSSRLVTQNGVILMGLAAVVVLLITAGSVSVLVVLYSINVFLTFTLSLAGLVRYWWSHRGESNWLLRLALSLLGLGVCAGILAVTTVEKFAEGGWITLIITGLVIAVGLAIHRHYDTMAARLNRAEQVYAPPSGRVNARPRIEPTRPAAAFIIGRNRCGLVHASRTVIGLWPGFYRNFLVITAQPVDVRSYGGDQALEKLKASRLEDMNYFMELARQHGMASKYYMGFGVDGVEELVKLCREARAEFPQIVFFASKLVFDDETWITRFLHNQIVYAIQRRLQGENMQMVILPMRVPEG